MGFIDKFFNRPEPETKPPALESPSDEEIPSPNQKLIEQYLQENSGNLDWALRHSGETKTILINQREHQVQTRKVLNGENDPINIVIFFFEPGNKLVCGVSFLKEVTWKIGPDYVQTEVHLEDDAKASGEIAKDMTPFLALLKALELVVMKRT